MTVVIRRRNHRRSLVIALVCGCALGVGHAPEPALAAPGHAQAGLQVSFDRAALVRLRGERFVSMAGADLDRVNAIVGRSPGVRVQRVIRGSEAEPDAARGRLERAGKRDVPDLNRHYRVLAEDAAERDRLLAALDPLVVVDEVLRTPEPAPLPVSPSFVPGQRYAGAAPVGIGAAAVAEAGMTGGRGDRVRIIDIEYSWNRSHEDLAKAAPAATLIANGTPSDPFTDNNHGTAVLGELIGTPNAFGVTGLAPDSGIGVINANSTLGYDPANAVNLARLNLSAGDVLLLEQQWPKTQNGTDYGPIEFLPDVHDAIRLATLEGIIVVEAAGNGAVDLDGPGVPQRPHSGAIIVGAGSGDCSGPPNARLPFSTFGSRVDLQGWGQCVTTTGYGHLYSADGANALYTGGFNGTSSAAPIVAAAAAIYSSVFQATADRAPTPAAVRNRLVATGIPQSEGDHIGPLPNVFAAVSGFDHVMPTVSIDTGPAGATNVTQPAFAFTASEPDATFECRLGDIAEFTPCVSPYTTAPLPDGSYTFEIRATDPALNSGPATARAFTVDTIAPGISIDAAPSGTTSQASPTFAFSSSEPGATFTCRTGPVLAPGAFTPCSSPYTPAPLADGVHTFTVQATDAASNASPAATREFTVDTPDPPASTDQGAAEPTSAAPPPFTSAGEVLGVVLAPPPPAPPEPELEPVTIGAAARTTVRVDRGGSGRLSRPRITCPKLPPACSVTARIHLTAGGARIGTATFAVPAGSSATIRFTLTKAGGSALARRGRLKALVRITARHGSRVTTATVRGITIDRARTRQKSRVDVGTARSSHR